MKRILVLALTAILASSLFAIRPNVEIHFTEVPRAGRGPASQGDIAGRVVNLPSAARHRIVLYARTDKWYVQPEVDSPYTTIQPNGTWSNWTHLGSRYGALVVEPSYRPAATLRALPELGKGVIAKKEVPARAE